MFEGTWYWSHTFLPVQEFVWYAGPTDGPYYNYLCLTYANGFKGASCLNDSIIPKPICQMK